MGGQQRIIEGSELRHHGKAIQMRHVDIEQDQVGARLAVAVEHLPRVLNQHQLLVTLHAQHAIEQLEVCRFVVDDQDAR
jgi:hypothetical protein